MRGRGGPSPAPEELPLPAIRRPAAAVSAAEDRPHSFPPLPLASAPATAVLRQGSPATAPAAPATDPAAAEPAATPAVPEPTGSGEAAAGPDLEHLADEVYTLIERRLTIEKENLGL